MAQYLYVCEFTGGLIKVGRANDPGVRIRQHADRVGCTGLKVARHSFTECAGSTLEREARLIKRCAEHASARHSNEWFEGLLFESVRGWVDEFASCNLEQSAHTRIIDFLGGTTAVALIFGIKPPSVHEWRTRGIPEDKLIRLAPRIESTPDTRIESTPDTRWNRKDLFPNDWQDIWPEMVSAGAPAPAKRRRTAAKAEA